MTSTRKSSSGSPASFSPASPVSRTWYEESFGEEYLRLYRHRNDAQGEREAGAAIEFLGLRPGESVLDLGCGAGRHVVPLAGFGLDVVGLDRSPELLAEARSRTGDRARIIQGDMRQLPFDRGFDAVLSFFTSFGYFVEEEENDRVLSEVARVLRPDGRFLLDLMDRESTVRGLVPESRREVDGMVVDDRRWITADGLRVEKETRVRTAEGKEHRFGESVRMYSPAEAERKLLAAGLRARRVLGDFDGREHVPGETARMILLGEHDQAPLRERWDR